MPKIPIIFFFLLLLPHFVKAQGQDESIDYHRKNWYTYHSDTPDSSLLQSAIYLMKKYSTLNKDSLLAVSEELQQRAKEKQNRQWQFYANRYKAHFYFLSGQAYSAKIFYHKALSLTDTIHDIDLRIKLFYQIAKVFQQDSEKDSTLYYLKESIRLAESHKLEESAISAYTSLGLYYSRNGQYIESINAHLKAVELLEKYKKTNPFTYANLGDLFEQVGLIEEAKENFKKAYQQFLEVNTYRSKVQSYALLIQYSETPEKAKEQVDEGLAIADSFDLKLPKLFLLVNAGQYFTEVEKFDYAFDYLLEGLQIATNVKSPFWKANSALYLSKIYQYRKQYQKSLQYCRETISFFESFPDDEKKALLYDIYSYNFEVVGQLDSALYYKTKKEKASGNINKQSLIKSIVSKYYKSKAEQERKIILLEKKNTEQAALRSMEQARQKSIIGLLTGALFIFISLFLLALYLQKKKRSALLEKINHSLELERVKLHQMNKKLKRFNFIISHDIVAGLDLILSSGNLFAASPNPKRDDLKKYYEFTQDASDQLRKYCKSIIKEAQTSKIEEVSLTDPMPIVQQVIKRFTPSLQEKNIQVELSQLHPSILPKFLVEQIFHNLISNAIRYGSITSSPYIRIMEVKNSKDHILWAIEDNGPGIPEEQLEEIFAERKEKSFKGNGLGLYLVKSSLQEVGSDIWVEKSPNGGARFIISIH